MFKIHFFSLPPHHDRLTLVLSSSISSSITFSAATSPSLGLRVPRFIPLHSPFQAVVSFPHGFFVQLSFYLFLFVLMFCCYIRSLVPRQIRPSVRRFGSNLLSVRRSVGSSVPILFPFPRNPLIRLAPRGGECDFHALPRR